jgi:hypothetical protein
MIEVEAEPVHDGLGQIAERPTAFDLDLPVDGRLVLECDPEDVGACSRHDRSPDRASRRSVCF